jgi:hypothetical protein
MAQGDVTDEELAELVPHADDFTLMAPYGGVTRRGFDNSPESLAEMARFFRGGECELEVEAA